MREAVLQENRVRTLGFSIEEEGARSVNGCVHLGVHLGYVDDREEWAETWRNWIT